MPDRRFVQSLSPDAVLDLQRSVGNRSVAQLFSGLGNAEVARLMRKPEGAEDQKKEGEEKKDEEEGDEKPAGLLGVISNVNKALNAVRDLGHKWDDMLKGHETSESRPLPPMASGEVTNDLDRVLEYETSRLVCEYVFEKAQLMGIDLRRQLGPMGDRAAAPPAPRPALVALSKDLDGLTALALGDLHIRAAKLIAERRQERRPNPERFWWNEQNLWGIFPSDPPRYGIGFGPRVLSFGEVRFAPQIGTFDQPLQAGLHPDVRLFEIPDSGRQLVKPFWFEGGEVETVADGDRINSVAVEVLAPLPAANHPDGEYFVRVKFNWQRNNTSMTCTLRSTADHAFVLAVELEGEPEVGFI